MRPKDAIAPVHRSRSSSLESFSHKKSERVDPEGNVDELGEFAAMIHRQNEERRMKELERRQKNQQGGGFGTGYTSTLSRTPSTLTRTPPPARSTMHPSRRTQSIGNLRSERRFHNYGDNMDATSDPKPLAYSKSASQSRASIRSMKRRAPQPTGPPQVPTPDGSNMRSTRPSRASSTTSIHRTRSRNTSQPALYASQPPVYAQPNQRESAYSSAYATPYVSTPNVVSSPGYADPDPVNSDNEDMPILRPSNDRPKPAVAPKPKLPPKQNSRYHSKPRNITADDLGELQRELDNSD